MQVYLHAHGGLQDDMQDWAAALTALMDASPATACVFIHDLAAKVGESNLAFYRRCAAPRCGYSLRSWTRCLPGRGGVMHDVAPARCGRGPPCNSSCVNALQDLRSSHLPPVLVKHGPVSPMKRSLLTVHKKAGADTSFKVN